MTSAAGNSKEGFRLGDVADWLMLIPAVVWIGLFLIVPTGLMVVLSFFTQSPRGFKTTFTLDNYSIVLTYANTLEQTLLLAVIITGILFVLGYPLAYFMAVKVKSDRVKTILLLLMLVPFWIDWTIRSIAWFPILGETGIVNVSLQSAGIIQAPIKEIFFTRISLLLVWVQAFILFMATPIYLSLIKMDPVLIQAAETLGANRFNSFWHITFRMSLPGVVIGSIFVFVFAMADYATPSLIGGGIQTIGLTVYSLVNYLQWPAAAALSTILIAIVSVFIYLMLKIVDVKRMLF